MAMKTNDIFSLVTQLERLEPQLIEALTGGRVEVLVEFSRLIKKLDFAWVSLKDVVYVDDLQFREKLRKYRQGESQGMKIIANILNDANWQAFDEGELADLALNHFYTWFSGEDYIKKMVEIDRIFSARKIDSRINSRINDYFAEARSCFAFGQYRSSISMCRLTLEAVCVFRLDETGELVGDKNSGWVNYKKSFQKFARLGGRPEGEFYDFYRELCGVVHGRVGISTDAALQKFKKTVRVVESMLELELSTP